MMSRDLSHHRAIAVLFSGGIDSTVLAYLLSKNMQSLGSPLPIELLSFSANPLSTDRKNSLAAFQELQAVDPSGNYRLVLIDKTVEQVVAMQDYLLATMFPKNTNMDFNIGGILHLASKGEGTLHPGEERYISESKVVFSGLGADELFSGYSRYWVAFQRGGLQELREEMDFDF